METRELLALQQYLHRQIPLSAAMGVAVVAAGPESVTLSAPLAPNINHRETVFGGSAAAVATLAAWALLHLRLNAGTTSARIVIQRSSMNFERPISGDFTATAVAPSAQDWGRFEQSLERRGKARITVQSRLELGGERVAVFQGDFVAFGGPAAQPPERRTV